MKKIYYILLIMLCMFFAQQNVNAEFGQVLPAGLQGLSPSSGAGTYGQMQTNQIKNYSIEKNLISPVEKMAPPQDDGPERFEVDVQKDLERDGVIYNPKFKVSKIVYEGNTKIKDKVLNSLADDMKFISKIY